MSEGSVKSATSRGWDEWCDLRDARPERLDGHTAIASFLVGEARLDGWWAQTVTVGYERITGLTPSIPTRRWNLHYRKTRTVTVNGDWLRALLLDGGARSELFPGLGTELRSKPTSKVIRRPWDHAVRAGPYSRRSNFGLDRP